MLTEKKWKQLINYTLSQRMITFCQLESLKNLVMLLAKKCKKYAIYFTITIAIVTITKISIV